MRLLEAQLLRALSSTRVSLLDLILKIGAALGVGALNVPLTCWIRWLTFVKSAFAATALCFYEQ